MLTPARPGLKKGRLGAGATAAGLIRKMDGWRRQLAGSLAMRNPGVTEGERGETVQATLSQLLFLRMCEGRGIEPCGQLLKLVPRLPDKPAVSVPPFGTESAGMKIDGTVLHDMIQGLYPPDCLCDFAGLPIEFLGQAHEHFLGKPIELSACRQMTIQRQAEIKKASGIYYTPTRIVDHIVENTLGKLLEGRTPRQADKLRIVDPACGSGQFLIGAYQYLLDWYRDRYLADGSTKRLCPASTGWQLTTAERTRILLGSMYGVDLDPQAVELTKYSLLLMALEGELQEVSVDSQRPGREQLLSDLANHIKCGNSLIGPDFHDPEGTRTFDWHAEFAKIFRAGGFDLVIGNPPWGQKEIARAEPTLRYLQQAYPSSRGIYDLFRPFVEKGISLVATGGLFGMVLPDIVLLKNYTETRRHLLDHLALDAIDWWGEAFGSAVIDVATITGRKVQAPAGHQVAVVVHDPDRPLRQEISQADFQAHPRCLFNLHLTPEKNQLLRRLAEFPRLGDHYEIHEGVHSGNIRDELFVSSAIDDTCRELYIGRGEIRPYWLCWAGRHVRLSKVPGSKRRERYANLGKQEWHERAKVLVRRTGDHVLAAVDRQGRYASNNFFVVFPRHSCVLGLDGLCALLNSRLMTWYFRTIEPRCGRAFAELKIKHLSVFPLPPLEGGGCQKMNTLGEERAAATMELARGSPAEQALASRNRITEMDRQIERHVYELYGLSAAELGIVEGCQVKSKAIESR